MRRSHFRIVVVSVVAVVFAVAATPPASALVIEVTTLADENGTGPACSLREAVASANTNTAVGGCLAGAPGSDAILFDNGLNGTIQLTEGQIQVQDDLWMVVEPALGRIEIRAAPDSRIFYTGTAFLSLDRLILSGGRQSGVEGGGAIRTAGGALAITDCILRDNQADSGGAVYVIGGAGETPPWLDVRDSLFGHNVATGDSGGAVYVHGADTTGDPDPAVVIEDTVFLENTAQSHGSALYVSYQYASLIRVAAVFNRCLAGGGALFFTASELSMMNSTVARNQAYYTGGLTVAGLETGDMVQLAFLTIAENTTSDGVASGVSFAHSTMGGSPTITLGKSIVAGNEGAPDCGTGTYSAPFSSTGYNVFGTVTACTSPLGTDTTGADPQLGLFGDNGGSTIMALPNYGSDAIDHVPVAACLNLSGSPLTVDQRGKTRPASAAFPPAQDPDCDAGAVERQPLEWLPWIFIDGFESGNSLFWSLTTP